MLGSACVALRNSFLSCIHRHTASPTDDVEMLYRKEIMTVAALVCLFAFPPSTYYYVFGDNPDHGLLLVGSAIAFLGGAVCLSYILYTRTAPDRLVECVMLTWTVSTLVVDMNQYLELSTRVWPSCILHVDILLVMDIRPATTRLILGVLCTYLLVTHVDETMHIGLRELDKGNHHVLACDCDDPPCKLPVPASATNYLMSIVIVLLDFYFTRRFANGMRKEQAAMQRSVGAAGAIAGSLSKFDLEEAEHHLSCTTVPTALRHSLSAILDNLLVYRPYLPDALFASLHPSAPTPNVLPPGTRTGRACVVFTDIVGSTALWSEEPEGMAKALRVHNAAIRSVIEDKGGYEVKTIGDSFMVAFETLEQGVGFGLSVQRALLECEWPQCLMQLPQCARDANKLWGGITVRIGLQEGVTSLEINPVTGRGDYFGTTVNAAARLEAVSPFGSIGMTGAAFNRLAYEMREDLHMRSLGARELKGLPGAVQVVALYPPELRDREHDRQTAPLRLPSPPGSATPPPTVPAAGGEGLKGVPFGGRNSVGLHAVPSASVASVEVAGVEDWCLASEAAWQSHVSFLLACVDRCQGNAVGLIGRALAVSWNALRACHSHVECVTAFVGMLGRAGGNRRYSVGCSTGPVTVGSLGRTGQLFLNVQGECVALCRRLGEVARLENRECLFGVVGTGVRMPGALRQRFARFREWKTVEGTWFRDYLVFEYVQDTEMDDDDALFCSISMGGADLQLGGSERQ